MSLPTASSVAKSSLEAIAYQGGPSPLYRDLVLLFQRAIDEDRSGTGGTYSPRKFEALNIGAVVRKHTGLNIDIKLDRDLNLVNACALPIILDPNNPFLQWIHDIGLGEVAEDWTTTRKKILPLTKELRGAIDLHHSKVSGVFSKIPTEIYMGAGLWRRAGMTAGEVAAICLHEIGHVFTFFEMILHTTTTNLTLMCAKRDINKMPSHEERVKLVYDVADALEVKVENVDKLASPNTAPTDFMAIFMAATSNSGMANTTQHGGKYDLRSSEVAADQWANRHGAGRDLALGLGKMYHGDVASMPIFIQAFIDIIGLCRWIALVVFGAAMMPALSAIIVLLTLGWLGLADPEFRIYDDPQERLLRLRKDTVHNLKSNLYNAKVREILLADLKQIDEIAAKFKDYRSIMNRLWIFIGSNRRAQYKQMRLEQELENLSNSNLFVAAAQLQTINSAGA